MEVYIVGERFPLSLLSFEKLLINSEAWQEGECKEQGTVEECVGALQKSAMDLIIIGIGNNPEAHTFTLEAAGTKRQSWLPTKTYKGRLISNHYVYLVEHS